MGGRLKLGQLLVNKKLITPEQLQAALGEHEQWGARLGMTLVRLGFLDEEDLVRALAGQLRLPVARIKGKHVKDDILERVPSELAEKYRCLPLFMREEAGSRVLFVAMEDPSDLEAIDDLAFQVGEKVRAVLVAPTELEEAIQRHYHGGTMTGPADPTGMGPLSVRSDDTGEDTAEQTDSTAPDLPPLESPLAPPTASVVSGLYDERTPSDSMFDMGPAPDLTADETLAPELSPSLHGQDTVAPKTDGASNLTAARGLEPSVILRALSQLLVEKGVLSREELSQRLRQLSAQETPSSS